MSGPLLPEDLDELRARVEASPHVEEELGTLLAAHDYWRRRCIIVEQDDLVRHGITRNDLLNYLVSLKWKCDDNLLFRAPCGDALPFPPRGLERHAYVKLSLILGVPVFDVLDAVVRLKTRAV